MYRGIFPYISECISEPPIKRENSYSSLSAIVLKDGLQFDLDICYKFLSIIVKLVPPPPLHSCSDYNFVDDNEGKVTNQRMNVKRVPDLLQLPNLSPQHLR